MARLLKCNSCGATYPDTRDSKTPLYIHVCADKVTDQHAVCDANGNITKPATFKPVENPRNENLKPDPDNPGKFVMVSEGSGITEIE